jgi:hypothetical protein
VFKEVLDPWGLAVKVVLECLRLATGSSVHINYAAANVQVDIKQVMGHSDQAGFVFGVSNQAYLVAAFPW